MSFDMRFSLEWGPLGVGREPTFETPGIVYFWSSIYKPKTVTFLEMVIFKTQWPKTAPNSTDNRPRAPGASSAKKNKPKFAPKHPVVGVRHAVACSTQSVHAARLRLSLIKIMEQRGGEVMYSQ